MADFKKEIQKRKVGGAGSSVLGSGSTQNTTSSDTIFSNENEKVRRTINISKNVDNLINGIMKETNMNRSILTENLLKAALNSNREIQDLIDANDKLKKLFEEL